MAVVVLPEATGLVSPRDVANGLRPDVALPTRDEAAASRRKQIAGQPAEVHTRLSDVLSHSMPKFLLIEAGVHPVRRLEAQTNPVEFEESVDVEWNRLSPPGASFAHMHFGSTKNYTVEMELYWGSKTFNDAAESEKARRLLLSWAYPNQRDGRSFGPPVLLAMWNKMFALPCYLVDVKIRHLRFATSGLSTRWQATIKLEELRKTFLPAGEVGDDVIIRGSEGGSPLANDVLINLPRNQ